MKYPRLYLVLRAIGLSTRVKPGNEATLGRTNLILRRSGSTDQARPGVHEPPKEAEERVTLVPSEYNWLRNVM